MDVKVGDSVSHYEIAGSLGAGGMGNVFKALDKRLGRFVALKSSRHALTDQLAREARLIASVSHRSICRLLDIGESDGASFLVFEYLDGVTLADRLNQGPLPLAQGMDVALELLNAVAAIHGTSLIHGDLKPANIMLTSDGPRVLDFGLARLLRRTGSDMSAAATATPAATGLCGTAGYIAPEQLNGASPTIFSDIFALGAVFYEMFSGQPAFAGGGALARLTATVQDSPPGLTGSRELISIDPILRRALAKAPSARFASASEFADQLRQAVHGAANPADATVIPAILVLPFRAPREDADLEFLAEMLLDAITSELASCASLQVRSNMVGKRYGPSPDLRVAAAETCVNVVVRGALARAGDHVRVDIQLVRVPAGGNLGSASFDCPIDDVYAVQSAVVKEITSAVETNFGVVAARPSGPPPVNAAYDMFLRANLAAQDKRRVAEACGLYEDCVRTDPSYAPAWARLGRLYRVLAKYYTQPLKNMKLADEALRTALSLDPDLCLAHGYYAQHEADEGRVIDALIRLVRASHVTPNSAEVFAGLTYVCRLCGLYEESIASHKMARKLDPTIATSVTQTYFQMGRYVECLETYSGQGIGYIEPLALDGLGMKEEAAARVSDFLLQDAGPTLGALYVRSLNALWSGDREQARRTIDLAAQSYFLGPEEHYYFARKRIVGNLEGGMAELRCAVRNGFYGYGALLRDPWLSSVRETAAFQEILEECEIGRRRAREAAGPLAI